MKILIVTQYFYPEAFRVNTLAKELVKRGHEVTVLTGYPQYPYGEIYEGYGFDIPYEKEWEGIKVERLKVVPRGKNIVGMLLNCLTFVTEGYKWVKKCDTKYDVVYVFEVSPVTVGLPAIKYKEKFGTPVLFNVQDLWPENVIEVLGINNKLIIGIINRIVDKIYKNSDKILCSSKGFVENIAERGVPREKLIFWPQFCEEPDFENMTKPECYDEDYFNVVFTGNVGYAQGLDLLVGAASLLKDAPVRWYIVGDGRAKAELIEAANDNGLSGIVNFIDKVSEHEANCYVRYADLAYLSFKDCKLFDMTIPAKLQTYLACGTPILGAVGGESAAIIREADVGLVTDRTMEEVAKGVHSLIAISDGKINHTRKTSYNYFNSNYNMEKLLMRFDKILDEVCL